MIKIFSIESGFCAEVSGVCYKLPDAFGLDKLFTEANPIAALQITLKNATQIAGPPATFRPLVESQEIWAAGVTYFRSRTARMEESNASGASRFYDKVYEAERPELFFKATPHRVAAPGAKLRIRSDSRWNVPEPELTLAINSAGKIFGYTIGNDMSSRDIEGENPLYLPQAKVYDRCAALGPCLVVSDALPGADTKIALEIRRDAKAVFSGETTVGQIKRPLPSLAEWLFRDNSFPRGCYLMTGTGIVPPDSFTLQSGDEIRIIISGIGTLANVIE